jgi:hypothetical protein
METSAVVMLVFGALSLWGGLALAIVNYVRASRRESVD